MSAHVLQLPLLGLEKPNSPDMPYKQRECTGSALKRQGIPGRFPLSKAWRVRWSRRAANPLMGYARVIVVLMHTTYSKCN